MPQSIHGTEHLPTSTLHGCNHMTLRSSSEKVPIAKDVCLREEKPVPLSFHFGRNRRALIHIEKVGNPLILPKNDKLKFVYERLNTQML